MLLCLLGGGGGVTPSSPGGGYPGYSPTIQIWSVGYPGYPPTIQTWDGGTPQTLDAVPPTQTWDGIPLHPPRPEMGYPTPRTGMGYPPPPTHRPGTGYPPLPARVDRLKILPSPHPSDAGGKNSNFHKSPPGICSIYKVNISPDGTSVGKL